MKRLFNYIKYYFKRIFLLIIRTLLSKSSIRELYRLMSLCVLRDNSIRHFEPSIFYSKEDLNTTTELITLVADAIKVASSTFLTCGRKDAGISFLNIFPGEHYRILNSLVKVSKAKKIVEIGTYTGLSALSLKHNLPDVTVTTFDIIQWNKLDVPSHFVPSDFYSANISSPPPLKQIVADLSKDKYFERYFNLLNDADIIFLDAPKDDKFEYAMAEKFKSLDSKNFKLLIVDDIQWINMIDFWRMIKSPKLDISSFGHFSGTGIVDISKGLRWG
jgi:hypothetical protein